MQWFRSQILSSEPIALGSRRVVVRSHAVQISLPFLKGAAVWNRPFAVHIEEGDGQEQTIPVIDITRLTQIVLLAASVFVVILVGRQSK